MRCLSAAILVLTACGSDAPDPEAGRGDAPPAEAGEAAPGAGAGSPGLVREGTSVAALPPEERKRLAEEIAARERQRREEIQRDLASSRPELRVDALEQMDPAEDGIDPFVNLLRNDPSPQVRVAAAEGLAFADEGAVPALLPALKDPDARVVIAALGSLEFVADESVVPELRFLLEHPDADVRQAAGDAIEFLE